eukprot:1556398-Pleurochrysis_carterae.AAC.1
MIFNFYQAHHEHDDLRRPSGIPEGALHRLGKSWRKAQDVGKRQSAQGAKQEMPGSEGTAQGAGSAGQRTARGGGW